MGSLMAGWSSHVLDSEKVLLKRNKSLTREEIDSFRRAQKPSREEEEDFTSDAALTPQTSPQEKDRARAKRTFMGFPDDASDVDKAAKTGDWWTRSNWAFLNEPPRDELSDSAHKYTAQFHVAHLAVNEST
ncbi:uncharacterized protein LOC122046294 [Zingiber officinale]|uniref:Uncharacterized protein n=1 Tax=Zingiber officinale TaxID=94328 RepID=A0A8J5HHG0_ZINOF|nr:uncharacterized protein LOC122041770 [Zingiber officinale]XP_042462837.1 uncharacterized protein LOC122046294 [Zingiber officinale]KAG6524746.1 hypothetical protein ZIOFF_014685 [Zingiber officinale]KAG6528579.1 hypothetical protein ZIOFF_010758 [Zingiber officinale]